MVIIRLFVHLVLVKVHILQNVMLLDVNLLHLMFVHQHRAVFTFPLAPQITSILERENLVSSTYVVGQCTDLWNSSRHHEIVMDENRIDPSRNIITFTLSSDGVLIKRTSRSLWITCACINELPRNKRFKINNILICSISTGGEKPKKNEYHIILQDVVKELKFLENYGFVIVLPSNNKINQNRYTHFHAYSIAAVCDKPAVSLNMNIKDSTGYFSCGWCYITGYTSFILFDRSVLIFFSHFLYAVFIYL
jgi:hypothetical protein